MGTAPEAICGSEPQEAAAMSFRGGLFMPAPAPKLASQT